MKNIIKSSIYIFIATILASIYRGNSGVVLDMPFGEVYPEDWILVLTITAAVQAVYYLKKTISL